MNPMKKHPPEKNEIRHYLGSQSFCSGESIYYFWFSQYIPRHPTHGAWAFWKCGDWSTDKPNLSCLKEVREAGLIDNYLNIKRVYPETNKILYAVKIGDPDYMEQVITDKEERIEEARAWAESNGFDRFRVAEIDLATPPDFTKTINL